MPPASAMELQCHSLNGRRPSTAYRLRAPEDNFKRCQRWPAAVLEDAIGLAAAKRSSGAFLQPGGPRAGRRVRAPGRHETSAAHGRRPHRHGFPRDRACAGDEDEHGGGPWGSPEDPRDRREKGRLRRHGARRNSHAPAQQPVWVVCP